MKIGIDISQVVYAGTGVSTYTENLVKALVQSNQSDEFVLFGSALNRCSQLLNFINSLPNRPSVTSKIYHLPPSVLSFLWNTWHVVPIEKFVGKTDVFHTSDWTEPPSKVPKITTVHDLVVYKYPQHLPNSIINAQKARLNWVKKESAGIIADSKATKQDIIEYLGIAEDKIQVVYLGVNESFYPRKAGEIQRVKNKYHIVGDYLLVIGTREPRKNLSRIITAYKQLKNSDIQLVVGGNYGWGSDVEKSENINLLGFVDTVDLPALYSGAASFVYPSLYEGFGLPVLEAMACGTLVVTSLRGSLAEITGKSAITVDPDNIDDITNGIKTSISYSDSERTGHINQGFMQAKTFTWEKTARQTLEVYKSVV